MREKISERKPSEQEIYEQKVKTKYSELGEKNLADPDIWGNALWEGKNINIYNDPNFVKKYFTDLIAAKYPNKEERLTVADFGGAEGTVLKIIDQQLKESGYSGVIPLDIDINLASLKEHDPDLTAVNSSLADLPLKDQSIDAGILRFTLPYNVKEKQVEILERISQSLKPGGTLLILQDGAYGRNEGKNYDDFFATASAAQGAKKLEEIKATRYFASGEEIIEMAETAGLKIIEAREIKEIKSQLSPQAYHSRFKMDESQERNLKEVFKEWEESKKLEFNEGRLERLLLQIVLEK